MSHKATALNSGPCLYSVPNELENAFDCALCSYLTTDPIQFRNHVRLEHRSNFLPCITCGKLYSACRGLLKHICFEHKLFIYCCGKEGCDFKTTVHKTFLFHIVKCTPSDFPCFGCKTVFSTPESLITHMEHFKRDKQKQSNVSPVRQFQFSDFPPSILPIKKTCRSSTAHVPTNEPTIKQSSQPSSTNSTSLPVETGISIGASYSLSFKPKQNASTVGIIKTPSPSQVRFRAICPKLANLKNAKIPADQSSNNTMILQKKDKPICGNTYYTYLKNTNFKSVSVSSVNSCLIKNSASTIKQTKKLLNLSQSCKTSTYRPIAAIIKSSDSTGKTIHKVLKSKDATLVRSRNPAVVSLIKKTKPVSHFVPIKKKLPELTKKPLQIQSKIKPLLCTKGETTDHDATRFINLSHPLLPKPVFINPSKSQQPAARRVQVGRVSSNILCKSPHDFPRIDQVGSEKEILASLSNTLGKTCLKINNSTAIQETSIPSSTQTKNSNIFPKSSILHNSKIVVPLKLRKVISEEEPEIILPTTTSSTIFFQANAPSPVTSICNIKKNFDSEETTPLSVYPTHVPSTESQNSFTTTVNVFNHLLSKTDCDHSKSSVSKKNAFKLVLSTPSKFLPIMKKPSTWTAAHSAKDQKTAYVIVKKDNDELPSAETSTACVESTTSSKVFECDGDVSVISSNCSEIFELNVCNLHRSTNTYSSKCRKEFLQKNKSINTQNLIDDSHVCTENILQKINETVKNRSSEESDKLPKDVNLPYCEDVDDKSETRSILLSDSDSKILDSQLESSQIDHCVKSHSFAYFTLNKTPFGDEVVIEMVEDSIKAENVDKLNICKRNFLLVPKSDSVSSINAASDSILSDGVDEESCGSLISDTPLVIDEGEYKSSRETNSCDELFRVNDNASQSSNCMSTIASANYGHENESCDAERDSFLCSTGMTVDQLLRTYKLENKVSKKQSCCPDQSFVLNLKSPKVLKLSCSYYSKSDSQQLNTVVPEHAVSAAGEHNNELPLCESDEKKDKVIFSNADSKSNPPLTEPETLLLVNSKSGNTLMFVNDDQELKLLSCKGESLTQSNNKDLAKETTMSVLPLLSCPPNASTSTTFALVTLPELESCKNSYAQVAPAQMFFQNCLFNDSHNKNGKRDIVLSSEDSKELGHCNSNVKTMSQYLHYLRQKKGNELLVKMSATSDYFKCMYSHCTYTTNWPDAFTEHFSEHKVSLVECAYCLKSFSSCNDMIKHSVQEHRRRIFQCPLCFYRACSKTHVQFHLQVYHPNCISPIMKGIAIVTQLAKMEEVPLTINVTMTSVNCLVSNCSFSSNSITDAAYHVWTQHKFLSQLQCSKCNTKFSFILNWLVHLKIHNVFLLQCLFCSYGCNKRMQMLNHLTSRHADFPLMTYARTSEKLLFILECYLNADPNVPFKAMQNCSSPSTCYCYLLSCPEFEGNSSRIKNLLENVKIKKMHFKMLECLYCLVKSSTIKKMEKHLQAEHSAEAQLKYYHCVSHPLSSSELKDLFDFRCSEGPPYSSWRWHSSINYSAIQKSLHKIKLFSMCKYLSNGQFQVHSILNNPHIIVSLSSITTGSTATICQKIVLSFIRYLREESSKTIYFVCSYCSKRSLRLKNLRLHWKNFHVGSGKKFAYSIVTKAARWNFQSTSDVRDVAQHNEKFYSMDYDLKRLTINALPNLYDRVKRRRKCSAAIETCEESKSYTKPEHLKRKMQNSGWDNCSLCKRAKLKLNSLGDCSANIPLSQSLKHQVYKSRFHSTKISVLFSEFSHPVKIPISYLEGLVNFHPVIVLG